MDIVQVSIVIWCLAAIIGTVSVVRFFISCISTWVQSVANEVAWKAVERHSNHRWAHGFPVCDCPCKKKETAP